MKLNKLFIGAIAALASAAMVACSDDAPDVNNGGENQDGGGYLAVNIVTPTGTSSRATSPGFELGEGAENRVENVTFFLYNEDGTPYQDPQTYYAKDYEDDKFEQEPGTEGGNVEKILKILMVIEDKSAGSKLPYQFLTVLNLENVVDGSTIATLGQLNMSALRNRINNYIPAAKDGSFDGSFVISNSVYVTDDGKEVCATEIPAVYKSTTDAEKEENAVKVYVERVVAKVNISAADNFNADNLTYEFTINEINKEGVTTTTPVTIKQEITGVGIANSISHSYLFKNVSDYAIWQTPWPAWTEPSNYRSYWAKSATKQTDGVKDVEYHTGNWKSITSATPAEFYVQENTTSDKNHYTSIIAAVQHKILKNGEYVPYAMIKWGGAIYIPDSYPVLMANVLTANGYRVKVVSEGNTTYRSIQPNELEMITDPAKQPTGFKQWETCCQLTTAATAFDFAVNTAGTYTPTDADAINAYLQTSLNRAQYWNDGMAYYYVPIEHFGSTPYNVGVVRNHLYKLSITSLTGLGTPVFNPDEEIIPNNPDQNTEKYYLAARINILSWKVVNQEVNFGE